MNKLKCLPSVRIGQVIAKSKRVDVSAVKVRCQDMRLNKHLLMYFPVKRDKWCIDKCQTKLGDIVVIGNLDQRHSKQIFSQVQYIMYPTGKTVDPLTGRKCRGTEFIDEHYGNNPSADYEQKPEIKM